MSPWDAPTVIGQLGDVRSSAVRSTLLGTPDSQEAATPEAEKLVPGGGRRQPRWLLCVKERIQPYVVLIAGVCLLLGAAIGYFYHSVPPSCPPVPPCPNKWLTSDGKCYFVSQETKAWDSSLEFCRSHGGTLLPPGYESQQEIVSLYDLSGDYWIGLRKDTDSGTWMQLDGAEWTTDIAYDNVQMKCSCVNSGKYVALDCSTPRRWICVRSL